MSRRKILPHEKLVEDITIIDIAEGGKGVGKANDLVYFVEKAVPGDVVDIELIRRKKNFAEAKISRIRKPSVHRVAPFCNHFGVCGGCKWQHMDYPAQLTYKQKSVADALSHLGKIDVSDMQDILPAPQSTYYRNKLEYTFSNKRWLTDVDDQFPENEMNALGFHVPLRFDKVLDIAHCYLQESPSNEIRNSLRAFALQEEISFYDLRLHEGALRNLIIRTAATGDLMVIVVFAYVDETTIQKTMTYLQAEFPQITSLLYIVNQKKNDTIFDQEVLLFAGNDHIVEEMEGIRFKIGPKSFYQTNSQQAYELYKITREFAELQPHHLVYDLYTGVGTIANFVARDVKEVIGIEYVPSAIEDAKVNSAINDIHNTKFFAGDMKDVLQADFVEQHGQPDVIITDPPRAGMHTDVVNRLLSIAAEKIVYVSCNAATQARDLALLKEKYEVVKIKPVDMFPHTQHVENVVLLTLK